MAGMLALGLIGAALIVWGTTYTGRAGTATIRHIWGNQYSASFTPATSGVSDPRKRAIGWMLNLAGACLIFAGFFVGALDFIPQSTNSSYPSRTEIAKKQQTLATRDKTEIPTAIYNYLTKQDPKHIEALAENSSPEHACKIVDHERECSFGRPNQSEFISLPSAKQPMVVAGAMYAKEDLVVDRLSKDLPTSESQCFVTYFTDIAPYRKPLFEQFKVIACKDRNDIILLSYPKLNQGPLANISTPAAFQGYFASIIR